MSLIVNVVSVELWVAASLLMILSCNPNRLPMQVRLYPTAGPFWPVLTGSIHDSVTLCEKNVMLVQLIGGAVGTVKSNK